MFGYTLFIDFDITQVKLFLSNPTIKEIDYYNDGLHGSDDMIYQPLQIVTSSTKEIIYNIPSADIDNVVKYLKESIFYN